MSLHTETVWGGGGGYAGMWGLVHQEMKAQMLIKKGGPSGGQREAERRARKAKGWGGSERGKRKGRGVQAGHMMKEVNDV